MSSDALKDHYDQVVTSIIEGRVIPFFGAGVNLCGRPKGLPWHRGQYLPSGSELAEHLAKRFRYPGSDRTDLVRVSQYVATMSGLGALYDELRKLFDADYPPTPLHRFFASLPHLLREKGYDTECQLIVTTNYDDLMERTFKQVGEPFDLVAYEAEDKVQRGKFWHWPPEGEPRLIDKPNKYRGLAPGERSVVLKIHGAIDRRNERRDSFVITEDHYIDYLTRTDISSLLPVTLAEKLGRSHFLFLGYSLRDWNLRVILHRIWREQRLRYKSWSIQLAPQPLDEKFWQKRDVDLFDVSLEDYVAALDARIRALPRVEELDE